MPQIQASQKGTALSLYKARLPAVRGVSPSQRSLLQALDSSSHPHSQVELCYILLSLIRKMFARSGKSRVPPIPIVSASTNLPAHPTSSFTNVNANATIGGTSRPDNPKGILKNSGHGKFKLALLPFSNCFTKHLQDLIATNQKKQMPRVVSVASVLLISCRC